MSTAEFISKFEQLSPKAQDVLQGQLDKLYEAERKSLSERKPFSRGYGSLKGQVWMSDDFNEPLEDMKDYM